MVRKEAQLEFGETIPLLFIFLCALIATPILGTIALFIIRFAFKDRQLTKNIVITILAISILGFIYPFGQLAYAATLTCRACPGSNLRITWDVVVATFKFSAGTLIFGIPCGYLVAFLLIIPATLAIRFVRRNQGADTNQPSA